MGVDCLPHPTREFPTHDVCKTPWWMGDQYNPGVICEKCGWHLHYAPGLEIWCANDACPDGPAAHRAQLRATIRKASMSRLGRATDTDLQVLETMLKANRVPEALIYINQLRSGL